MDTFRVETLADIEALEVVPIERRLKVLNSTYDVLARRAAHAPDSVELVFAPDGSSATPAIEVTYDGPTGALAFPERTPPALISPGP